MEEVETCKKGTHVPVEPSTRCSFPSIDEEVVGFVEEADIIVQKLIDGTKELDVISIFGMAGLGKTTLARKVYNNPSIVNRFDVHVWCSVSQTYNVRTLLVEILKQTARSMSEIHEDDDDLADKLRKSLIGKRYLIVLDDIWEVEAWEDLRLSFPNSENGSRVMVTTRVEEVAKQLKHCNDPYPLRFLTEEESWELLRKKVFRGDNSCTPDLLEAGLHVAKHCKGLPLVIVLIAGIIANVERQASSWLKITNELSSHVLGEQSMKVIQSSYDHLEDHLKPPLLYMAYYFPEDNNILASDLLEYWMAEEFVQNFESGDMQEETAKVFLNELVNRSLVIVSKRRANNGDIKCCMLHDVVREFCLRKLADENFMQHILPYNPYQPLNYSKEPSRLVRFISSYKDILDQHNHRSVESLEFVLPPDNIVHPFHIVKLRFIRVLRFDMIGASSSFVEALKLTDQLTYLEISDGEDFDFEWVSHLCHLQTLKVYTMSHTIRTSIAPFWKMSKLRHVYITNFSFIWEDKDKEYYFNNSCRAPVLLENLTTFGGYHISTTDMNLQFWNRFPNLEKFEIRFEDIGNTNLSLLPGQDNVRLQSLKLSFSTCCLSNSPYLFPLYLKDVRLGSPIREDMLTSIASLPNLEHLRLRDVNSDDEMACWDVGDHKFPALKCLKLQHSCMSQWHCSEESFPVLERLVLTHCWYLEEIPSSFVDITTLKFIKVINCKDSTGESALNIKQEVEDISGSDTLQVLISKLW